MINKSKILIYQLIIFPLILITQKTLASVSCEAPLELNLLTEKSENVVTANSFSQKTSTIPSLWWPKEQVDNYGGRLINNWLAFPQEKRIDLIVNTQLWSIMNYLDHYRFVNSFGTVVRFYNYNLRVFNQNKKCLALYYYDQKKWQLDFTDSLNNSWEMNK